MRGEGSIYRPRGSGWRVEMQRWMKDEVRLRHPKKGAHGLCFFGAN